MKINLVERKTSGYLKGIAAVFIMLGHFVEGFPWYIQMLFSGNLWVALFFFYSGYGLNYSYNNKKDYLKDFIPKKLIGVYCPFLLAETAYTVAACFINHKFNAVDFILGCFGLVLNNSTLWYVAEIIVIYALFYVQKKVFNNKQSVVLWIIAFLAFMIIGVFKDIGPWWYVSTSAFFMGYYFDDLKKVYDYILKHKIWTVLISIAFLVLYAASSFFSITKTSLMGIKYTYFIVLIELVIVPFFIFFMMSAVQLFDIGKESKFLSVLGNFSYEIYLWHMFSFLIVGLFAENKIIRLVVSLVLTFAVAALSGKFRNLICNKKVRSL